MDDVPGGDLDGARARGSDLGNARTYGTLDFGRQECASLLPHVFPLHCASLQGQNY